MNSTTYLERRGQLKTYFDATALDAWARLTSDAPLSRIRATVRAGRERMRAKLLEYLPADLRGRRVLDAGCGTGALAVEAARRGAEVVAIDLSPALIDLARSRQPHQLGEGRIHFRVGDMLDPSLGRFHHVIAMDSLIHYRVPDVARALAALAPRVERSMLFTIAPRTPLLMAMWTIGRLFPRGHRAPALEPVSAQALSAGIVGEAPLSSWRPGRTERIASGFYTSQAVELEHA